MKTYQVWTEGFAATGQHSGAIFHGDFKGNSFKEAVISFRESILDESSYNLVDMDRMSFWGCRFYDNEGEARKSFG